jgi:broad specificity phosphatase PhoE
MTNDRSESAQEDEAIERHAEREADQVFVRDRAAIVAALQSALKPHKWESYHDATERVRRWITTVEQKPDVLLSHLTPLADFAEWYGMDMLWKAFELARTTSQVSSDEVLHV